ncbi:hypothetical protein Salat_2819700 [Sesamum alatum]|uniref:Uncharacterized protein n=1 Tax=Sesamum alatum TaxID=300844 RepID=A0AAE1XLN7_9LAMI|nr:hypothetical protein Salat_2819700 [Sesamum alatum]
MVMIRAERHLKMPPPAYYPNTQSLTVAVYSGGELRNLPVATCIGGTLKNLIMLMGHLLYSDEDILEQASNHLESRKFTVYIEQNPPQPEEVAVECGLGKEKGKKHVNVVVSETKANIQQPVLPPIVPDEVTNQAEGSTENMSQTILTEPGPHGTQVSQQGPSMYEQLQMGQNTMPMPPQTSLQPRLNIRVPPPMTGQTFMPCFSNKPVNPVSKTIIQEHGQKFVELSKWPTSAKKK